MAIMLAEIQGHKGTQHFFGEGTQRKGHKGTQRDTAFFRVGSCKPVLDFLF